MIIEPTFIEIDDVAELIHKKKRTIQRYCTLSIIPYYKVGKDVLFIKDEVIEWVLEKRVQIKKII